MSAHRFPCPGCAAGMEFDPAVGQLKCPYCAITQAVPDAPADAVAEHPIAHFAGGAAVTRLRRIADAALQVSCATCGATVEFVPPEIAGACPFCGANIVAQPKAADPLIAPDGVLPFVVPKSDATASVRTWLATRWFAPGALKRLARPEGLGGVYLPFWTFDAQTESDYDGERGDYYYETEYYTERGADGRTLQRQRQVRHTRWYPASGSVALSFDDILVPAVKSVQRPKLDALDPWGLESVAPYEPAYLAGFKAQRYQVEMEEGFEHAKGVMADSIRDAIHRDIGGDEQRIHSVNTAYSEVTFKHLLLPVWIGAYRFQEKVYQVLVNARTGEVQGERPYSAAKIALLAVAILAVILILAMLGSRQ